MLRAALRLSLRAFLCLLVSIGLYAAAGVVGAFVPARTASIPPSEPGPRLWVLAGPIHTDIVVPLIHGEVDWRPLVAAPAFGADAETLAFWRETVPYVAISWGSRDFFAGVPRFSDMRPVHLWAALWDESAVHLTLIDRPDTIEGAVALELSAAQYEALAAFIDASLAGGRGAPRALSGMSYTDHDGFYASGLRYSLARTCNVWTGDALAAAGVEVGAWTPTPGGLMRGLRRWNETAP